jgi:hypothetical protein
VCGLAAAAARSDLADANLQSKSAIFGYIIGIEGRKFTAVSFSLHRSRARRPHPIQSPGHPLPPVMLRQLVPHHDSPTMHGVPIVSGAAPLLELDLRLHLRSKFSCSLSARYDAAKHERDQLHDREPLRHAARLSEQACGTIGTQEHKAACRPHVRPQDQIPIPPHHVLTGIRRTPLPCRDRGRLPRSPRQPPWTSCGFCSPGCRSSVANTYAACGTDVC